MFKQLFESKTLATLKQMLEQLALFTQTKKGFYLMPNLQDGSNDYETNRTTKIVNFLLTYQLLKSHDLSRESGNIVVTGSMVS